MRKVFTALSVALVLTACGPRYTLVPPATTAAAKGKIRVAPAIAWNRAPKGPADIAEAETWTENGPLLDQLTFIGGLPEGRAITRQKAKADQKVPVFQAGMSPQDLTSMLETLHRIHGETVFESVGVAPRTFLGHAGLQYDYSFVGSDDVRRRGRGTMAVIEHRFYLMSLEATDSD